MEEKITNKGVSRRNFLAGAALAGVAAAGAGLAGCAPAGNSAKGDASKGAAAAETDAPAWLGVEPEVAESDIRRPRKPTSLLLALAPRACAPLARLPTLA